MSVLFLDKRLYISHFDSLGHFFYVFILVGGFILSGGGAQGQGFSSVTEMALHPIKYYPPVDSSRFWDTYHLNDEVYPLGWSGEGHFAYIVEPADEACGCYFFKLIIKDLVKNETVWLWEYDGSEEIEYGQMQDSLASILRKNDSLFSAKLDHYRIVRDLRVTWKEGPLTFPSQGAHISVDTTLSSREFWGEQLFVEDLTISYQGSQKTVQTIYERKTEEFPLIYESELYGFLQNPIGPGYALFLIDVHRGWEGPPNVRRVTIVGFTPE